MTSFWSKITDAASRYVVLYAVILILISVGVTFGPDLHRLNKLFSAPMKIRALSEHYSETAILRAPGPNDSIEASEQITAGILSEILQKKSALERMSSPWDLLSIDSHIERTELKAQIAILEKLHAHAVTLANFQKRLLEGKSQLKEIPDQLERFNTEIEFRRSNLPGLRTRLAHTEATLLNYESANPLYIQVPLTSAWFAHKDLMGQRGAAENDLKESARRIDWLVEQTSALNTHREELSREQNEERPAAPDLRLNEDELSDVVLDLNERIEKEAASNSFARLFENAQKSYMNAFLVMICLIVAGPISSTVLYFLVAPVVSQRFRVVLNNDSKHASDAPTEFSSVSDSQTSVSVAVREGEALYTQPQFIQSLPVQPKKRTVWVYDWSRPLMCLSTSLHALTRIDPSESGMIVLAAKEDDRNELAVLTLSPGESFVVNPRSVVGIIDSADKPVHLSSRWMLFSIDSWLRFRLRYLIFHGPARLIIQGRRGVRFATADAGQAISQAATIGFDTRLAYSVARSETFAAYLSGAQELFSDCFSGKGIYIYQVSNATLAQGPARWWRRVVDTVLRAAGIG